MSFQFSCASCSKILTANERAAGREIVCPYCRQTIKIPVLSFEDDGKGSKSSSPSSWKPKPGADGTSDPFGSVCPRFVEGDDDPFEPFQQADAEAMRAVCPSFEPNPCSVAYPFEEAIKGIDPSLFEEEEEEAHSEALDDPDYVDKLIAGFGED